MGSWVKLFQDQTQRQVPEPEEKLSEGWEDGWISNTKGEESSKEEEAGQ